MITLPLPSGVHLLRKELGVGSNDIRDGVIHASPFTGAWSRVVFSRNALWNGRLVFGAETHDGDARVRAWINEAVGNVLAVPLSAMEEGYLSRPAMPAITAAIRKEDGTAELTLDAAASAEWIGSLATIGNRMVRILDISSMKARIFPAVIPEDLPAAFDANGHFIFHVIDIAGGERKPWGLTDITLEVVEAHTATAPALLPDHAVFWNGHAVHWNGSVVRWEPGDTGLLQWNQRLIEWNGRLVAWLP